MYEALYTPCSLSAHHIYRWRRGSNRWAESWCTDCSDVLVWKQLSARCTLSGLSDRDSHGAPGHLLRPSQWISLLHVASSAANVHGIFLLGFKKDNLSVSLPVMAVGSSTNVNCLADMMHKLPWANIAENIKCVMKLSTVFACSGTETWGKQRTADDISTYLHIYWHTMGHIFIRSAGHWTLYLNLPLLLQRT